MTFIYLTLIGLRITLFTLLAGTGQNVRHALSLCLLVYATLKTLAHEKKERQNKRHRVSEINQKLKFGPCVLVVD